MPSRLSFTPSLRPFEHQRLHVERHMRDPIHALYWEQGTAKTAPTIHTFSQLFLEGEIDFVLLVTPRGADRNWANEEIPIHMPPEVSEQTKIMVWRGGAHRRKWHLAELKALLDHKGLSILTIQYASFNVRDTKNTIWKILRKRKVFYILDEASGEGGIKKPSGKRAHAIVASGRYAKWKRILDGTPVAEGPFDAYMPIKFLDENFWKKRGMHDFNAFKNRFGRWLTAAEAKKELGWDPGYDKLIEYCNLLELNGYLNEIGSRILKDDVFDLPPKLYSKLPYDITPEQRALYEQLRDDFAIDFGNGKILTAELAIVRLLRFQQILCGYLPRGDGEPTTLIDGDNPRLETQVSAARNANHQALIWCRFVKDIDLICEALGKGAVPYDGRRDDDELEHNKVAFQKGNAQWFVGNSAMSSSLTLHMAKSVYFYSNSFKLRARLQAEDRAHRAGLKHSVDYRDIVAFDTADTHVVDALRNKWDISALITGDKLREWI